MPRNALPEFLTYEESSNEGYIISMIATIMASQDVHVLIPRTHEYITFYGKKDLTNVIIKNLEIGRLYWITKWAQSNHMGP